jgi:hypothetical protein
MIRRRAHDKTHPIGHEEAARITEESIPPAWPLPPHGRSD